MFAWYQQLTTPEGLSHLLAVAGPLLLIGVVFAETGLLVGFFLPGDSLLMTAGVLCSFNPTDHAAAPPLDFVTLGLCLNLAAICGDALNYTLGRLTGRRIWERPDSRFFKRRHLLEAHAFYERWGGWAIAGGRFVPVARTFVPFLAGVARMRLRTYLIFNIAGGSAWIWSMLGLGWWLGGQEAMRRNLHYLVLAIVALSFVPVAIGILRRRRAGPPAA